MSSTERIQLCQYTNSEFKDRDNFLFMGYLVPKKNVGDLSENVIIKT